ncbi:MAG: AAA family ATPase, partial [Collinsella sp.]|nr:AAA family ATPase [Collinsella sp.]
MLSRWSLKWHRYSKRGDKTVSEQAMYDIDNTFDVKLLNPGGNAVLPIDIHDFADAADHCVLVDKTMFIADILDCESTVALCCRPHGFGKSMNLSMLKCYLERPVPGSSSVNLFIGSQIWDAEDGIYRDEYARYPVIALDFSASSYRGADAEAAMRDVVARECARLLPLLDVPDLARGDVRHIERVARGVAGSDEIDSALGVLIELLRMACDEQVVLLVDGYDAAFTNHMQAKGAYGSCFVELLDRLLFEGIVSSVDSLRLVCLMGERPGPAQAAFAHRNCPYCLASPLSSWCDRRFGFSDAENRALLDYTGQSDRLACAREWFEGYRF